MYLTLVTQECSVRKYYSVMSYVMRQGGRVTGYTNRKKLVLTGSLYTQLHLPIRPHSYLTSELTAIIPVIRSRCDHMP